MKPDKHSLRNSVENLFSYRTPLSRRSLLALGAAASFFGGSTTTAQASNGHEATSGVKQQVIDTSEHEAKTIIADYDSRKGNPNERSKIVGLGGRLDVITVVYNAPDFITKKAGEYELVAEVKTGPDGQPDPDRIQEVKIEIAPGTGNSPAISEPQYTYIASPINEGQAWTVDTRIDEHGRNNVYNYTTGTPVKGSSFALSSSNFQSLSSQAGSVIYSAPHHKAIEELTLPFPAPIAE